MEDKIKENIYTELRAIVDPEIGFDIVSLGFIYGLEIREDKAIVTMTLSTQSCPLHSFILDMVENAVKKVVTECEINLVWEPSWSIELATQEIRDRMS